MQTRQNGAIDDKTPNFGCAMGVKLSIRKFP